MQQKQMHAWVRKSGYKTNHILIDFIYSFPCRKVCNYVFSNCTLISVIAHLFNQSEARTFQIRRIMLSLLLLRAIRPSNDNLKMATVITAVACCCHCKGTWIAEML